MKIKNFIYININTSIMKYVLAVFLSVLTYWLVYPDFSLTNTEINVKVERKIGGYTYYRYGEYDVISKKGIREEEKIGENVKINVKLKNNPEFKHDNNVQSEVIIFVCYLFGIIFLGIFCFIEGLPKPWWIGLGLSIVFALRTIWLL